MECDSLAYHFGEVAHQGDRTRRRRLTRLGWDIYEYTYQDVTKRPTTVLAQELRSVLGSLISHLELCAVASECRSQPRQFRFGGGSSC